MSSPRDRFNSVNNETDRHSHLSEPITKGVVGRAGLRNLVNRYINSEIGICLHLHSWIESIDLETGDLCYVFQKAVPGGHNVPNGCGTRDADLGICIGGPRRDNVELPMAVLSGPVTQNPEGAINIEDHQIKRELRSVVRLYRLNEVPTLLREWLYLPSCVLEVPTSETDRKFQAILIGGRVLSGLDNGSLVNASVESRSQVIERFTQFESARQGQVVRRTDADSPCPVILHIYENVIGVFFEPVSPKFPEGFAVSDCPYDTIPAALEWW